MKKTFTTLALGLGLIAGFASQAHAEPGYGPPTDLVTLKATLKIANGLKVQTVSFTNKDLLAFAQAPKGSKLGCYMSEDVTYLNMPMVVITKDGSINELDENEYAGAVQAYVYVDGSDYDYFTVKETKNSYSFKTDGYLGWGVYLYTGEYDYTYFEFYSDTHSAKLTQSYTETKKGTIYAQSASDTGMYLYDSELVIDDSSSYPFLDGEGSVSLSGTFKQFMIP